MFLRKLFEKGLYATQNKEIEPGKFQALGISQGGIGITSAYSPYPVIGSHGAAVCSIVGIYSEKSKKAFVAHVDFRVNNDTDYLKKFIKHFCSETRDAHFSVVIASELSEKNHFSLSPKITQLLNEISEENNVHFSIQNRCSEYLAIDARSGICPTPVDKSDEYQFRYPHDDALLEGAKDAIERPPLSLQVYINPCSHRPREGQPEKRYIEGIKNINHNTPSSF